MIKRKREIIQYGTALLMVFALLFYIYYLSFKNELSDIESEHIKTHAEIIKSDLAFIMHSGQGAELSNFFLSLRSRDIDMVRLIRPDGKIIGSTNPAEVGHRLDFPPTEAHHEVSTSKQSGRLLHTLVVPIYNEMTCHACHGSDHEVRGYLELLSLTGHVRDKLNRIRLRTVLLFVLVVSITAGFFMITIRGFIRRHPLKLKEVLRRVNEGDQDVRFSEKESGELSEPLNRLVEDLHRARIEMFRARSETMQKLDKMATVGELASAIAHDIKNPLAGISGAIQVLAEDFPDDDPRKEIIRDVLEEIEHLDKTVRDLLNFSRPPEPLPILDSVEPVIELSQRLVKMQADKQFVKIVTEFDPDRALCLFDPDSLQQVLVNLMLNAIQSMPEGGTLSLRTTHQQADGKMRISINDTGHGITTDDLSRIFRPFYTTKTRGTGLGLVISRELVQNMGGAIEVESAVGKGTSFHVILPVERSQKDVQGSHTGS